MIAFARMCCRKSNTSRRDRTGSTCATSSTAGMDSARPDMRSLDDVTIVGENTHGILSDSLPKFLSSGIYFSLSNEEYQSPDGEIFKRIGVPPDIEAVHFSKSDREEGRDTALEVAASSLENGGRLSE